MIFKNYCAVFFNPSHISNELNNIVSKISEDSPRIMKGKGISLYTFTSVIDVSILSEYFTSYGVNFLLFDLAKNNSGFNFVDKEKENSLFGFLNKNKKTDNELLSDMLLDNLISTEFKSVKLQKNKQTVDDLDEIFSRIENMSKNDRNVMVNEIIDKGIENLNESDKKILEKISKLQ